MKNIVTLYNQEQMQKIVEIRLGSKKYLDKKIIRNGIICSYIYLFSNSNGHGIKMKRFFNAERNQR
jgi:hypothetical protein